MDYFPHDTDAASDEKVEALRFLFGNDGYAFYFILLERIYRTPKAELDISAPETRQILARKVGVTDEQFEKMLAFATSQYMFDNKSYTVRKVLTSSGIKRRAKVVLQKRAQAQKKYRERCSADDTEEGEEVSGEFRKQKPDRKPTKERKGKGSKGNTKGVCDVPPLSETPHDPHTVQLLDVDPKDFAPPILCNNPTLSAAVRAAQPDWSNCRRDDFVMALVGAIKDPNSPLITHASVLRMLADNDGHAPQYSQRAEAWVNHITGVLAKEQTTQPGGSLTDAEKQANKRRFIEQKRMTTKGLMEVHGDVGTVRQILLDDHDAGELIDEIMAEVHANVAVAK